MSYEKQNFVKGQILKADHLNHMEDGIAAAAVGVQGPKGDKGDVGPQGPKGDKGDTGPAATLDPTLSVSGNAADAKATGDAVSQLREDIALRDVFVTPEMFGAVGDGNTDDTAAIQAAINAADKVVFGKKTYLVNKVQFDKSVELVGGTDTVIRTRTRKHAFYCAAAKPKAQLTLAADYMYTDDAGSCGALRLAVNDASLVEIGDILKIYANNQLYNPNRKYYYKGACVLVTDVDRENNCVSIGFVIPFDILAEGTLVDVYRGNTVHVRNMKFRSELDDDGSGSSFGLYIKGGANCLIENCTFDGFTHSIYLDCCVNSMIRACQMAHVKRDNTFAWDGYGICVGSCNNTIVEQVICRCGQHALTTGGTIPVFNTHIRDCNMFSECRQYAIGCHENNYDIIIENSVIAGAWVTGNVNVRGARFVQNEELGSSILITGNEGALNDIIEFDHVTFDSDLRISISAYTGESTQRAFSNDVGRVIFNNCYGGRFWIANLSGDSNITGSVVKSITVNNWLECHGFKLEYGTIEKLKVNGLRFHLEINASGFITSPTAIEIGTNCNVLKMVNEEEVRLAYDELALKSPAIRSDAVTGTDIEIEAGENTRLTSMEVFGKPDENIFRDTIVFESDNLIPGLDTFRIDVEGFNLNGYSNARNFPKFKIPEAWKAGKFYLSATIDTTNANVNAQNSVRAYLFDSYGNLIYTSGLSGRYEQTIYRSTVNFVIPDEAYTIIISAVLLASGDKAARAYDFKFHTNDEFKLNTKYGFMALPVSQGGTFTDKNGQQYLCNYVDYNNNVFMRQVEMLYNSSIKASMLTDMGTYFADGIVGGFIPRSIVEASNKLGRNLDDYASDLPVLNTDTPPTDEESIWIHDGGIGFAFSVEKVGARTMDALAQYVNGLPNFLTCRLYAPSSLTVSHTETMQYNAIRLRGGRTRVYSQNGGYFRLGYYCDTKDYIDKRTAAVSAELLNEIKTLRALIESGGS